MADLVLALDASLAPLDLALGDLDGELLASAHAERGTRSPIASALQAALAEIGGQPADIKEIVVGLGPGGFTALRSVNAFAQGFALQGELSCGAFSSMLAAAQLIDAPRVAVLHDARRSEVFLSVWHEQSAELAPQMLPRAEAPARLRELAAQSPLTVIGSAIDALSGAALPASLSVSEEPLRPAAGLLKLWALTPPAQRPPLSEPHYIRPPDAKVPQSAEQALAALRKHAAERAARRR